MGYTNEYAKDRAELKLVVLESAKELGLKVESHINKMRMQNKNLILDITESVFASGERKTVLNESIRGKDIYIICDIGNYGLTYNIRGNINHCSPYDNYKAVKDVIGAISGSADRITVIMPLLIDSRQHRREKREPLSCAQYLQELVSIGVSTIITFDVHDKGVKMAIPVNAFDSSSLSAPMLKRFIKEEQDKIDFDDLIVISPDQGAGPRTEKVSNQLGCPMGTFSKKRDLSKVVNGKNAIFSHEYMGPKLKNKNVLIVDDIISSGDSMLDIAVTAKQKGANKVYFMATFPLFTQGIDRFIKAKEEGLFEKVYTTNCTYIDPEYLKHDWIIPVDSSLVIAGLINHCNIDKSIGPIMNAQERLVTKKAKVLSKK